MKSVKSLCKLLACFASLGIFATIWISTYSSIDKHIVAPFQQVQRAQLLNASRRSSQRIVLGHGAAILRYTMDSSVCESTRFPGVERDLLAIILVISYVGHAKLRAAHRIAISQEKLAAIGFQRVFMIAQFPLAERSVKQSFVEREQQNFGDLVQGSFHDTYRNMSYKHIMALKWAGTACEQAKFILKLDDDTVYDVFHMNRYLMEMTVKQPGILNSSALLIGSVFGGGPIRNVHSKWYVPVAEYPRKWYPKYLSGSFYITNPATALRLAKAAETKPVFWIDDVWVTGTLRTRLRIPLQSMGQWYAMAYGDHMRCCLRDLKALNYTCDYFIGMNGNEAKIVDFIRSVEKCYTRTDACHERPANQSLSKTCKKGQ